MPQLINYGEEMLRVSPKGIEYSTSGGRSWMTRYSGSLCGTFIDFLRRWRSRAFSYYQQRFVLFNKRRKKLDEKELKSNISIK